MAHRPLVVFFVATCGGALADTPIGVFTRLKALGSSTFHLEHLLLLHHIRLKPPLILRHLAR